MIGGVVSNPHDNVVMEGRQILNACFFINEVIGSRLKSSRRGVIDKIDIKKAYGQTKYWDFLLLVLEKIDLVRNALIGLSGVSQEQPF